MYVGVGIKITAFDVDPFSRFDSVIWSNLSYSLWHRESAVIALFIIIFLKKFRHHVLLYVHENLEKTELWVSLLLNLILYWWFLVNLLIPNTYKFALLVMLPEHNNDLVVISHIATLFSTLILSLILWNLQ